MNGIAGNRKIVGEEIGGESAVGADAPTLPAATNTASGLTCAMKRSTASEYRKSSSRRVAVIISHRSRSSRRAMAAPTMPACPET
jgi:hypothetical protein